MKVKIKKYLDLIIMQKKYISFSFGTKPFNTQKSKNFYYTIRKIYGPSAYLDVTTKKNISWESVSETKKTAATSFFFVRQEDTTIYSVLIGNVISATVIKPLKMKLIFY